MKRRLLSLFLAIAMIATMVVSVPITSFAGSTGTAADEFSNFKLVRDTTADTEGDDGVYGYTLTCEQAGNVPGITNIIVLDKAANDIVGLD